MQKLTLAIGVFFICCSLQSQMGSKRTTPSALATIIPAFSQVSTINSATVNINSSLPAPDPIPIDGDTTKEFDRTMSYGNYLTTNIQFSQGNITSTSIVSMSPYPIINRIKHSQTIMVIAPHTINAFQTKKQYQEPLICSSLVENSDQAR